MSLLILVADTKIFFFTWNDVARLREEPSNDVFVKYWGEAATAPCPSPPPLHCWGPCVVAFFSSELKHFSYKYSGHLCIKSSAFIKAFIPINWFADKAWLKIEFLEIMSISTKNAMRCNNRDDLLHLTSTLKISIF